jgi:hypothetical protein
MKKVITIFTVLVIFLSFTVDIKAQNSSEKQYLKDVSEVMKDYPIDIMGAKSKLAAMNTELVNEPNIQYCGGSSKTSDIQTYGINPTDYVISTYSFRRTGQNTYYLQTLIQSKRDEWFSGPLDYVSIEYDNNFANYYLSSGDGVMSSVKNRNTGIVLFNIEDSKLGSGKSTYVTVQVTPKVFNVWLEHGSKYVHTYSTLAFYGGSASYSMSSSITLDVAGEAA